METDTQHPELPSPAPPAGLPDDPHAAWPLEPQVVPHRFAAERLDPDAVRAVRRLVGYGFEAYLVGGCVRDLLLGESPKDFDVVTSARPAEIRRLFRNCRLIGRRFRLAHLLFREGKIIEVSTFRRAATSEDDLTEAHAAENLFGAPREDALRRDFTINALMYDVLRGEIRDYVDGLGDVERRLLRTIGDPEDRLPEDPVRIVRAVKFAEKLGLDIEPRLAEAMCRHADKIGTCAPARLVEELFKLLRSGAASRCLERTLHCGLIGQLLPALAQAIQDEAVRRATLELVRRLDAVVQEGGRPSDPLLLAALLGAALRPALDAPGADPAATLDEAIAALVAPMRFTKAQLFRLRELLVGQRRLRRGPAGKKQRRYTEREIFPDALAFLALVDPSEEAARLRAAWLAAAAEVEAEPADVAGTDPAAAQEAAPAKRRRRRRGGRGRGRRITGEAPTAEPANGELAGPQNPVL